MWAHDLQYASINTEINTDVNVCAYTGTYLYEYVDSLALST